MIKLNDLLSTRLEEGLIKGFNPYEGDEISIAFDRTCLTIMYESQDARDKDIERLDAILYVKDMDEIISRWETGAELEDCNDAPRETCADSNDAPSLHTITWEDLRFVKSEQSQRDAMLGNVKCSVLSYYRYDIPYVEVIVDLSGEGTLTFWGDDIEDRDLFNNLKLLPVLG